MENKVSKILYYLSFVLGVALVLSIFVQIFSISKYNNTPHTVKGTDIDDKVSVVISGRSGDSASWPKSNLGLEGRIYDATFHNGTPDIVSSWELRIDIVRDCYISQFWNGDVEIHQNVEDPEREEVVQTLNLASYDVNNMELDYMIDGPDLMIPLKKGDYMIYHPSTEFNESPLGANSDVSVGFIVYYRRFMEFPDYNIDYYYQKNVIQGPMFIISVVLTFALLLTISMNISASYIYKKAAKEMELRKSGISCMMGLYAAIYIIDVKKNSIESVGEMEDIVDRPKNASAEEQLDYIFKTDPEEQYRSSLIKYSKLDSLKEELKEKGRVVIEYKSINHGWFRIRFMAMDKDSRSVNRILLTVHDIDDEKQELDKARHKVELIESESKEKRESMEGIFKEAQAPVNSILDLNARIMERAQDTEIRDLSREIKRIGESFVYLMNNTLDYSYIESGKMEIVPEEYSFKNMIDEVVEKGRSIASAKNVEFITDISSDIPDRLIGDAFRLKQVLLNLIKALSREIKDGNITLRIYGSLKDDDKVHMLFSVKEKGYDEVVSDEEMEMFISKGIVSLMGAELKSALIGDGCDYYFELEQDVVKN